MPKNVYVTTSIPYVNSRPHLGFALELAQADALARYSRLTGHPTRFQTGTDENAFKNVLAARACGVTTQELVNRNAELFKRLSDALCVSYDSFVRTTDPAHAQGVHCLWRSLRPRDIYRRRYAGLYCVGCEDFFLPRDLVNGRCPDHEAPLITVEEENWFFRLSAYQEQLEDLIGEGRIVILPEARRNEVLSFIRRGLVDISVSRDADRCGGWGIRVPGDEGQVIYVWIDALINYVSGLGYGRSEEWRQWWCDDATKIHVIGKNVWKFHAVYWPALLLSAGLPVPDRILVHGFLTEDGRKISKSAGATIDPFDCIDRYGADAVRYYLLRAVSPFGDSDVSLERLRARRNSDLANGLGNLVSRLNTLWLRSGGEPIAAFGAPEAPENYHEALAAGSFDRALEGLWERVTRINREIERAQPWQALRDGRPQSIQSSVARWLGELRALARWLAPFLPDAGLRIQEIVQEPSPALNPLWPRV